MRRKQTKHQKSLARQRARRTAELSAAVNEVIGPVQFTCANCGAEVPWRGETKLKGDTLLARSNDSCPECEWSRHVAYGTDELPPCGEMLKPVEFFYRKLYNNATGQVAMVPFVVRRCQGCGWELTAPLQRVQEQLGYSVDLIKFGANGDGKKMDSPFADFNYQKSGDEVAAALAG